MKALLFDLDGTLLDGEKALQAARARGVGGGIKGSPFGRAGIPPAG